MVGLSGFRAYREPRPLPPRRRRRPRCSIRLRRRRRICSRLLLASATQGACRPWWSWCLVNWIDALVASTAHCPTHHSRIALATTPQVLTQWSVVDRDDSLLFLLITPILRQLNELFLLLSLLLSLARGHLPIDPHNILSQINCTQWICEKARCGVQSKQQGKGTDEQLTTQLRCGSQCDAPAAGWGDSLSSDGGNRIAHASSLPRHVCARQIATQAGDLRLGAWRNTCSRPHSFGMFRLNGHYCCRQCRL